MKIVLASGSPRRKELMGIICSGFEVRISDVCEVLPQDIRTSCAPAYLAKLKAEAAALSPGEAVIGCDTVVVKNGKIMGKPKDREDCRKMLRYLSGSTHEVLTGVCVRTETETFTFTEKTLVTFYSLSDSEIDAYMDTGEPFDKAGGYGIQGKGSLLVKKIDGDYFNVVGLPVSRLYRELSAHDII